MMIVNIVCNIPTMSSTLLRLLLIVFPFLLFSGTVVISLDLDTYVSREQQKQYDYRQRGYIIDRRTDVNHHRGMNVDDDEFIITEQQRDFLLSSFNQMRKTTTIKDIARSSVLASTDHQLSHQLDDLIMIENEHNDFEWSHRMMMITNVTNNVTRSCVRNQKQLEMIIMDSPDDSAIPTTINICKEYINIDASKPNNITGFGGIHIVQKIINIRCIIKPPKKCIIDARRKSRHFYIMNSTILFNRITFMNGNATNNFPWGGSLYIDSSEILLNNSDFVNNTVISTKNMGDDSFGGAIVSLNCTMKLVNVHMISNRASGGAIASTGIIQMFNVSFLNNSATYEVCKLFCSFCLEKKKTPSID